MNRWVGRVAIVTGTSSGIGAAIARQLAENGMKVVGVARRVDRVKVLSAELQGSKGELHAVQGDVTKEEDVVRVVKWTRDNLGGADVLVNNAGVGGLIPLSDANIAQIRKILDTNVLGLCMFTREVIKDMRERGVDDGHIFHINSRNGHALVDIPNISVYTASKHAVTVLNEGLRRELRDLKTKIKVTSISPGAVRTEIVVASGMSQEFADNVYYKDTPCLEPRDVADALLYALATPPHVQIHDLLIKPLGEGN